MIAIKLGGSFITDKSNYRTFRKYETERALKGIIKFGEPFVLVHGAGSFGHILCRQSGFPGTYKGKESQLSRVKYDTLNFRRGSWKYSIDELSHLYYFSTS